MKPAARSHIRQRRGVHSRERGAPCTFKRGKAAVENQLEVAKVALRQDDGGQRLGFRGKLGLARKVAGKEVLEDAAVGSVGHGEFRGRGSTVDGRWLKV